HVYRIRDELGPALDDLDQAIYLDGKIEYYEFTRRVVLWKLQLDDAAEEYTARVGRIKSGWSRTLGSFLGGTIGEKELLAAAAIDGHDPTATERQCEAYYYLAQVRLHHHDIPGAIDALARCLATHVTYYFEYSLGIAERRRLAAGQ